MSPFATYLTGVLIVILGLAIAAYLLNVPAIWIGVGVLVLIGLGIVLATSHSNRPNPPTRS